MRGARGLIGFVALVCVSGLLVTDVASASTSRRRPANCHRATTTFHQEATRWFDAWVLPAGIDHPVPVRTRGCFWITSLRQFVPKPEAELQTTAAEMVAALREQGYALARTSNEAVSVWSTHTCPDDVACDLVLSVVDTPSERVIEAEFLRGRSRCHARAATFRVDQARVFDTWEIPDGVIRSATPDRTTASPCWYVDFTRQFVAASGVSLPTAATRLVAALREQGYRLKSVFPGKDGPWMWDAHDCPERPGCLLTVTMVEKSHRIEATVVR
jgi:hypothetical protein